MKYTVNFINLTDEDLSYTDLINVSNSHGGLHLRNISGRWTSLFAIVRRTIDVHFSKEVGEYKGSWKGGTLGCVYEILLDEEPLDCLKRMERERKF
jgi:hypothetical protein